MSAHATHEQVPGHDTAPGRAYLCYVDTACAADYASSCGVTAPTSVAMPGAPTLLPSAACAVDAADTNILVRRLLRLRDQYFGRVFAVLRLPRCGRCWALVALVGVELLRLQMKSARVPGMVAKALLPALLGVVGSLDVLLLEGRAGVLTDALRGGGSSSSVATSRLFGRGLMFLRWVFFTMLLRASYLYWIRRMTGNNAMPLASARRARVLLTTVGALVLLLMLATFVVVAVADAGAGSALASDSSVTGYVASTYGTR